MTTNLPMNSEDQDRVRGLLTEAVTVLCKNGLKFSSHITIDGLLGVTVDSSDVFLIKISETVSKGQDNSTFSQVAQLLGAAKSNYGLSLCSDSSPPMTTYHLQGEKDHNDNHAPPVINIAPTSGRSLISPQTVHAKRRMADRSSPYEPQGKRAHLASSDGWELSRDSPEDMVIKSEPLDSDDEVPRYSGMKTLGVISTIQPEPTSDSGEEDDGSSNHTFSDQQGGEHQDGVLAALRAALIHKLANGSTQSNTPTPKQNNNNNNNNNTTPKQPTSNSKKASKSATKETPETEQMLKCLMCTYETKRRYNFIRHMRGHSKSYAIYACDLCGDRFHSEEELGTHGLEAHKGHHLTCDQCGMTFMSERGKNIHGKTHKMMPIPDKKTVECETQCTDQEVEETMARHRAIGTKTDKPYSALRSQLSSSSMLFYYPVLNGKPGGISTEGSSSTEAEIANEGSKSTGTGTETDISTSSTWSSATETVSENAKDTKSSPAQPAETEATPSTSKAKENAPKPSTSSSLTRSLLKKPPSDMTMDATKTATPPENVPLSLVRSRSSATPPPTKSIESALEAVAKKGKAKEVLATSSTSSSSPLPTDLSISPAASTSSSSADANKGVKIVNMVPATSLSVEAKKEKSRKQDSTLITRVVPMVPVKAEPEEASK